MRPTRQVARLSERAATLAGFVATEDRGRSIAVFNLRFCTFSTPILYQRIPSSRSRTAKKARTFFNAIRTLSLHGVTSVQAQPNSFVPFQNAKSSSCGDLVAGELHHIDVIRDRLFAGRLARTTDRYEYPKRHRRQRRCCARYQWQYAGELAVEAIDDRLLANSSPGARRPSLWLERRGMNRFLPLPLRQYQHRR
jgi:hypothetical protein